MKKIFLILIVGLLLLIPWVLPKILPTIVERSLCLMERCEEISSSLSPDGTKKILLQQKESFQMSFEVFLRQKQEEGFDKPQKIGSMSLKTNESVQSIVYDWSFDSRELIVWINHKPVFLYDFVKADRIRYSPNEAYLLPFPEQLGVYTKEDLAELLIKANYIQPEAFLWAAALKGEETIVQKLIEFDVQVDQLYSGETPLNRAARSGQLGVIKLLLEAKADPCLVSRGKYRLPPYIIAKKYGYQHVANELIRQGGYCGMEDRWIANANYAPINESR